MALGAGSGLRISEVVGSPKSGIPPLTTDMVDLKAHQIRIIQGKGKKDRITVTSPWLNKTNIQMLPLDTPIRTMQWRFNQISKKTLGKRCNFHMLRHSFGNYMINDKKMPFPMVQQLLGHSRGETTFMYAKANPVQAIETAWESF